MNNKQLALSFASGTFEISPLDGDLRVKPGNELDREEQEFYNLTICATNPGSNPLQAMVGNSAFAIK